jgi:putative colanic acid biosynthesis UDP-glucose lipid carrier transferase
MHRSTCVHAANNRSRDVECHRCDTDARRRRFSGRALSSASRPSIQVSRIPQNYSSVYRILVIFDVVHVHGSREELQAKEDRMQSTENVVALTRSTTYASETSSATHSMPLHVSLNVAAADDDGVVSLVNLLLRAIDPAVTVGVLIASAAYYGLPFSNALLAVSCIAALLALLLFRQAAVNQPWRQGAVGLVANIIGSWAMLAGILMLLAAITGTTAQFVNPAVYAWLALAPVAVLFSHLAARAGLLYYLKAAASARRTVIVGVNPLSLRLMAAFESASTPGVSFCGFFDDRNLPRVPGGRSQNLRGAIQDLPEFVKREKIHVIYIALPMVKRARIMWLLESLRDTTASIYFVPDLFVFDLIQGRIVGINGVPVVAVCETPFIGVKSVVKRLSDIVIASAILVLISPILAGIAFAVKWTSPGPILFRQRRYGMDGREIIIYKFRTMSVCEDGDYILQARARDPRVTRIGSILRRTSLDELPQFINVLQGRMSIVGPRPHAVAHNELYRKLIKGYMVRHKVRPGITGWAQINGMRGATESVDKMQRRIEFDLDYLRRWSLSLDLKIIFRTIFVMFRDRNAY